jgi:hypothetical protein
MASGRQSIIRESLSFTGLTFVTDSSVRSIYRLYQHVAKETIITCCVSGRGSSSAKSMLLSNGYASVYNGGSWTQLRSKI